MNGIKAKETKVTKVNSKKETKSKKEKVKVVPVDKKKKKDKKDKAQTQKVKKRFVEFLKDNGGGNISFTCKRLGINRANIYQWRDADKKFKIFLEEAVDEGKETLADEAEVSLRSIVRKGDSRAVIFTLKNLRPKRWRDSQVIEQEGQIEFEGISDELKKAAKEVYGKFRRDIRKPNTKRSKKK